MTVTLVSLPAPEFETFTYPRYRHLLRGEPSPNDRIRVAGSVLFGAREEGRPVAAALLGPLNEQGTARRLLSVKVSPDHRRRGLATAVVRALEEWAGKQERLNRLWASHNDRMKGLDAYLGMMKAAGWAGPDLIQQRLAGEVDWTHRMDENWAPLRRRQDRQGFAMRRYDQRQIGDDERIQDLEAAGMVEPELRLAPFASFGLAELTFLIYRRGEVVGWIVGERSRDVTGIHYTVGYVVPELRGAAWLIRGLWQACRRQEAVFGPKSVAVFETSGRNGEMQRLMVERLGPLAPLWIDRLYSLHRTFAGPG